MEPRNPRSRKSGHSNLRQRHQEKAKKVVQVPVEDTIIDVIEEPAPGVVVVTEYESIRTATPISSGREPKGSGGPENDAQ